MNHVVNNSDLLSRLQCGDKKAFEALYELHSRKIYLNLIKLVKSEELAGEILQDIFVLLWEKRTKVEITQNFESYLFGICAHKVADIFRKLKRDKQLFERIRAVATEEYSHVEEALFRRENSTLLQKAIQILPPQRKQIFELCKIQGESYLEVSQKLGISTSTINDHIVKATKTIREYLTSNNLFIGAFIILLLSE